jgi:tripartite-type tricarboxylate transporter receptor subunit TctC
MKPRLAADLLVLLVTTLVGLGGVSAGAFAQEPAWPQRTVQFIVPYTPGTGADILSRLLSPVLSQAWKVPVVTENRAGASGNLGADLVAHAPADGYSLLFTATSFATNPPLQPNLPFDPIRSFAPVAVVAASSMALMVNPAVPARTVREFVELARRQPGALYYGSTGNGGPQHLTMELIKLETGIDLVHVPYKGSGGALADLVAGHVQAMVVSLQTVAPFVANGRLRMLAVLSDRRQGAFAEVPTLAEAGYPGLVVDTWYAVFAPAGTPASVIARINSALAQAANRPEIRAQLARQGMAPVGGPPERLAETLRRDLDRWGRVIAAAHIKAD